VGEGDSQKAGNSVGLAGVLVVAVLGGVVGAASLFLTQQRGEPANPTASTPVIILSVADRLRSGEDALAIRARADRLAAGGFLVLDAQAVLAAPPALYRPVGEGSAP
jgi:hypothetical protein